MASLSAPISSVTSKQKYRCHFFNSKTKFFFCCCCFGSDRILDDHWPVSFISWFILDSSGFMNELDSLGHRWPENLNQISEEFQWRWRHSKMASEAILEGSLKDPDNCWEEAETWKTVDGTRRFLKAVERIGANPEKKLKNPETLSKDRKESEPNSMKTWNQAKESLKIS